MKPRDSEPSELDAVKKRLEKTEAALVQSEKMASLGNLVAGVAHEINTPVGSIHSNSDLMVRALEKLRKIVEEAPQLENQTELARVLDTLEDISKVNRNACERIVAMVRSLKSFARMEEPECRTVNIHDEIDAALMLVHHELKNRIEVVRDYGDLPVIECFPNHLNQVFVNLLVNASQAIEGEGRIRITTEQDGDHIRIEFEDSGTGISPDDIDKVFEPGFTTKEAGDGTGLGLSISRKIIEAHHGKIEVESTPAQGSTFTITLPIQAQTPNDA